PPACQIWRRTVHGLKNRGIYADVGARGHSQPTDQPGDFIREDIPEKVGCDDDVKLPGVEHELHGAGIHDAFVYLNTAFITPPHLPDSLQKKPRKRFEDVGLVHDGHLLARIIDRVLKRKLSDAPAACPG